MKHINSQKDCKGLWTDYLPGKTIYKVDNGLYVGYYVASGYARVIALRPLTADEIKSLQSRGLLQGLKTY